MGFATFLRQAAVVLFGHLLRYAGMTSLPVFIAQWMWGFLCVSGAATNPSLLKRTASVNLCWLACLWLPHTSMSKSPLRSALTGNIEHEQSPAASHPLRSLHAANHTLNAILQP